MAELIWTAPARTALQNIFNYIAKDNPVAAQRIITEILAATKNLVAFPMSGRPGRVGDSRELVIPRTPYVLAYRLNGDKVTILHIFHGAQQWPERL